MSESEAEYEHDGTSLISMVRVLDGSCDVRTGGDTAGRELALFWPGARLVDATEHVHPGALVNRQAVTPELREAGSDFDVLAAMQNGNGDRAPRRRGPWEWSSGRCLQKTSAAWNITQSGLIAFFA
jgi:hypothetical protein